MATVTSGRPERGDNSRLPLAYFVCGIVTVAIGLFHALYVEGVFFAR